MHQQRTLFQTWGKAVKDAPIMPEEKKSICIRHGARKATPCNREGCNHYAVRGGLFYGHGAEETRRDIRRRLQSVRTLQLPPGPLGITVDISPADGTCKVTSNTNEESPLKVDDVIESLDGTMLVDVEGGPSAAWLSLLEAADGPRNIVVRRWSKPEETF